MNESTTPPSDGDDDQLFDDQARQEVHNELWEQPTWGLEMNGKFVEVDVAALKTLWSEQEEGRFTDLFISSLSASDEGEASSSEDALNEMLVSARKDNPDVVLREQDLTELDLTEEHTSEECEAPPPPDTPDIPEIIECFLPPGFYPAVGMVADTGAVMAI